MAMFYRWLGPAHRVGSLSLFNGINVRLGVTRVERVVMTASASDLTSFACSDNQQYTLFDQCFIDAWPRQHTWGSLADDINGCIRSTENNGNFPESKPQFFF
jgi:hypothetical protein